MHDIGGVACSCAEPSARLFNSMYVQAGHQQGDLNSAAALAVQDAYVQVGGVSPSLFKNLDGAA
jgi:hypothetical protein